jgi:hypothetical protein
MTDHEVIARQARQIAEMDDEIGDLREALHAIRLKLIWIGGPLNGNMLGYSNEQLKPLQEILTLAEIAL